MLWNSRTAWKRGCLVLIGGWALWRSIRHLSQLYRVFQRGCRRSEERPQYFVGLQLGLGAKPKEFEVLDGRARRGDLSCSFISAGEPAAYGIDAVNIPGISFARGLQSAWIRAFRSFLPLAQVTSMPAKFTPRCEADFIRSFRLQEPVATIGYSILIFKLDPSDPQTNYTLGTIMALRGELSLAEELFRKVLEALPSSARVHEALAQVLGLEQKFTEAEYHYKQALAIYRSQPARPDSR